LHARRRDQRERLIRAAREVFSSSGYAAASIDEIVTRARVSRTTFYRFFAGKEECLLAVFEEAMTDLAAAFDRAARAAEPEERIRLGVEGIVAGLASDPETARVILVEAVGASSRIEEARREARGRFTALLAAELRRDSAWRDRPGAELELVSLAVIAGIAEAVGDLVADGKAERWPEIVDPLTSFAAGALTLPARRARATAG
jgi:AcrR family transcriptional regulator